MRLLPQLAFYVSLIAETLKDIAWFMLVFVLCIFVFANAMYVLNQIKTPEGGDYD